MDRVYVFYDPKCILYQGLSDTEYYLAIFMLSTTFTEVLS
jgi:hypothetical protein